MIQSGLYVITSEALCREPTALTAAASAAIVGGATMLQYRDKWNDAATRSALARQLRSICRRGAVRFIVNDDVELALAVQADGVHLGAADGDVSQARSRLGSDAIIGVTCGASLDRARAAAAAGASYVAFGRMFPSRTKPDAPAAPLSVLRQARAALALPVCAIGGITPDNAPRVLAQGADLIAVVDAVFGADDVRAAAEALAGLFACQAG